MCAGHATETDPREERKRIPSALDFARATCQACDINTNSCVFGWCRGTFSVSKSCLVSNWQRAQ
jgi:hypothetical protein